MSLLKRDNAMSKPPGYAFSGTKGDIVHLIQNLPPKPNKKFLEDWTDITHPEARKNSDNIKYEHKRTGLRVRFDPATPGAQGFNGKDHWHVYNPDATSKLNAYLDENANPTRKGSDPSHILPKG